jgi:hypothetical protein
MHNLYMVYEDSRSIKCIFYTVVIRNEALSEKYPGGIKAFVERYAPRSNNEITVTVHMGGDFEEVVEDLLNQGLEYDSDFTCFDAARYLIGADIIEGYQDIGFNSPWLQGTYSDKGVFVWHRAGHC